MVESHLSSFEERTSSAKQRRLIGGRFVLHVFFLHPDTDYAKVSD
jgi:hypothetical protein